nr:unnamed protein product [Spirometra erinaceieuropaei]
MEEAVDNADIALTIMCSDNEVTNSLSKNASLHVSISDINDETPTFELSEYTGHVRENSANAEVRLVPPIHTTDADVGRNSLISYSIRELPNTMQNPNATDSDSESPAGEKGRSSFHASLFHIDPRSGKIRTTAELDCESVDRDLQSTESKTAPESTKQEAVSYFSFTKSSRNSEKRGSSSNKGIGSGVGLTAIKHDISTLPHPNQPRVNDYHTLGDCFPEEVFYMDQKQTPASQHKKQTLREGTYEISGPFTDVTNNNNGYNANILMTNEISPMPTHYLTSMPTFPNNSSTINVSSKQLYGSGPRTPLLVATLRAPPTEFVESHPAAAKLDVGSRSQPVLHKASTNRVLALNQYAGEEMRSTANPTFYVATEAYQTLDPLTLSKNSETERI